MYCFVGLVGGGVRCDCSRAWEFVEEVLCGVMFQVGSAVVSGCVDAQVR